MGRLIKYGFYLGVLALLGLVGFAYLGDMSAPQTEVTIIVTPDES